jgi:peptidoglycan/xylan/chitin deacetylase (PgdA/CDA1 family)
MAIRGASYLSLGLTLMVAAGGAAAPADQATVALTFDDLPSHSALPPGMSRSEIARSILAALQAHHAPPTYGFVNAKGLEEGPDTAEVLRLWRDAGHPLANHAFSHMDLNTNTVEAFEQDVIADEPTLRTSMGDADWHWLRYPYLHEGDTPQKRQAVASFLKGRGYRVAEVTLSFDDYAYNEPYARCLTKDNFEAIEWMRESYLKRAADSISVGQEAAKRVWGRDIAHVMLLHIGAFQTVMLPELLDLLEQRGLRLVTLQEAESDAAYAVDAGVPPGSQATPLERMSAAKPAAAPADDALARLGALCR